MMTYTSKTNNDVATTERSMSGSSSSSRHYSRRTSRASGELNVLLSEKERSMRRRVSAGLECANLRFENLHVLVGREEEIGALRLAYGRARGRRVTRTSSSMEAEEEITAGLLLADEAENSNDDTRKQNNTSCQKELVLIAGTSGCGKSKLASTLAERVDKSGGLFVQGKYDLYFRDEPYYGISQACSEIVGHILHFNREGGDDHDQEKFDKLCELLKKEIGDELHLLANVIPPIVEIVGEDFIKASPESTNDDGAGGIINPNLEQSREQFNFAFKKFFRVITTDQSIFGGPLVMSLDDIHWADASSLELLEMLLTDQESSGLMIVGCYRSEEVMGTHLLSRTICEMKKKSESQLFHITELALEHLSLDNVNEILLELLSIDEVETTMPLAALCHKQTSGNPFHLITFLRMLEDERFLEFNLGSFRWIFDVETIEKKTSAASNVVDMVTKRLEQVPNHLQKVLHIAACLGSSFEFEVLYLVWNEMGQVEESKNQLDIYVQQAVDENILQSDGDCVRFEDPAMNRRYHSNNTSVTLRWIHDNVQEAAMMLGNRTSPDDVRSKVGLLLLDKFRENAVDASILFVIANLLSYGDLSCLHEEKREEIAKINLKAAERATACSAFKSAARYVKNGVALLSTDAFTKNYDLALKLFTLGTEVEGLVGNDDQMQDYYDEVILNARNSLDKIRCYSAKLSRLQATQRTKNGIKLCLDVLDELGCKLPRNPVSQTFKAIAGLRKVKEIKRKTIDNLPIIEDPKLLSTILILNELNTCSHVDGNALLLVLGSCKMYQILMKDGICSMSTYALITLAVVKSAMGKFKVALNFCDHALHLLPRFESKSETSRAYFISYFYVKAWVMPFMSCLKYILVGYQLGMECGNTESATWSMLTYMNMRMMAGSNLDSIVADFRTYLPQATELGRLEAALGLKISLQANLCFMGLSDNPENPAEIPTEDFKSELQSDESKISLLCYQVMQSYVYSIFGEHEKGAKLALQRGNEFAKLSPGSAMIMLDTFHRGVSLFGMARRTKKVKYKRAAKICLQTIKKWAKAGNPNIIHSLAILEAEQFALAGVKEKACQTYEKSITLSVRGGRLPDAGLASERYGEYLSDEIKNKEKAVHYFKKALNLYKDWGAMAKIEQMKLQIF